MKLILPIALLALAAMPACAQQPQRDGTRLLDQLEKADTNGDGSISRQEFVANRETQFTRLDRNHDGFMTQGDIPRMVKRRRPESGASIDQMIAALDKDGDGKVSRDEFVNGPAPVFNLADKDGDGVVTKAELESARATLANR